jgi:glycosyltransferase involved in cell wall biosynthesis
VAIDARAAIRAQIGGVERLAREMAFRLPRLRPDRYRVIAPRARLAHRAGHAWEQFVLPVRAARQALVYCPANLAPALCERSVVVIHDLAALRFPAAYSRSYLAYQRLMLPRIARRARLVITVSEFSRRELAEMLDLDPERIEVIPNGVGEEFAPVEGPAPASRHGLTRPYVLALGTVSERKNLGVLELAARRLAGHGIEVVVAGADRRYLRSSDFRLRRLGYVAEVELPALYAGARALAMPSRYEGFGLPCLEAMACGTPVVAARCGALPETVGDAGVLIDPEDAQGFADALMAVSCDPATRAALVAAGRERAAAFPWSRTAALTDAALGRLLDGAPDEPAAC